MQLIYLPCRERYRDLIEAADTITEMKNSAQNVSYSCFLQMHIDDIVHCTISVPKCVLLHVRSTKVQIGFCPFAV